jgi:hypothetical protein
MCSYKCYYVDIYSFIFVLFLLLARCIWFLRCSWEHWMYCVELLCNRNIMLWSSFTRIPVFLCIGWIDFCILEKRCSPVVVLVCYPWWYFMWFYICCSSVFPVVLVRVMVTELPANSEQNSWNWNTKLHGQPEENQMYMYMNNRFYDTQQINSHCILNYLLFLLLVGWD